MQERSSVVFYVNEKRCEVAGDLAFQTLAEFLRYEQSLRGTKIVCAEGDCGACTVLLGFPSEEKSGKLRYRPVNSCILPVHSLDGSHLVTVEGLKKGSELHPVQKAMVENFGAQCGYCTPGIVCALAGLAEACLSEGTGTITEKKARNHLTGNLCRCTGYEPILRAAQAIPLRSTEKLALRYADPARDSELRSVRKSSVLAVGRDRRVSIPSTLEKALTLKASCPGMKVIAGSTDAGVLVNKGREVHAEVLSLQKIAELRRIRKTRQWVEVGARVTLTELEKFAEEHVPELGRLLHVFASPQIKNRATLVGNVVNASPIADCIPFLLVADGEVKLQSRRRKRVVPLQEFYLGYKKLALKPDELVTGVRFRIPSKGAFLRLYKVARRKDLDISAVTVAAQLELDHDRIRSARLALGGVGPTVLRMAKLEKKWIGAQFTRELFLKSGDELPGLIRPLSDVRGESAFRMKLCQNLLLKLFDEINAEKSS